MTTKTRAGKTERAGRLFGWFETGTEGTIWALQDEKYGPGDYDGLVTLKNGDELDIILPASENRHTNQDGDVVLWTGRLKLVHSFAATEDDYLSQYVRKWPGGHGQQLAFAGMWVHTLPRNVDLGLWYAVFVASPERFRGRLRR